MVEIDILWREKEKKLEEREIIVKREKLNIHNGSVCIQKVKSNKKWGVKEMSGCQNFGITQT
mgnify:CR=1 FL=1